MASVLAHEIVETLTDPYPSSGWINTSGNGEAGDICAWHFGPVTKTASGANSTLSLPGADGQVHGYFVQPAFINAAGGYCGTGALSAFGATGSLATARSNETATTLANGNVLVAGGDNGVAIASAELYTTATGTFSSVGNLTTARTGHTAVLLPNGNVLIAGGQSNPNDTSTGLASAELYNPATGKFTSAGNMTMPRAQHSAVLLQNGTVLVMGGQSGATTTASAEIYNPTANTWKATGNLKTARQNAAATVLQSGLVVIGGGSNNGTLLNTIEMTTTTAATAFWVPFASHTLAAATQGLTAATVPAGYGSMNNGVVFFGGVGSGGTTAASYQSEYKIGATGLISSAVGLGKNTMANTRSGHASVALRSGATLAIGGTQGNGAIKSVEFFNSYVDVYYGSGWTPAPALTTPRFGHSAALVKAADGTPQVLVVGGQNAGGYLTSAELLSSAVF